MVLLKSLTKELTTKSTDIAQKFSKLRSQLAKHQLDAYFVPSADEHLNEYLPEAKQRRQWISGFTGSAGDFLISADQAWVFVDSRYYEQADMQVDAKLQKICKVGLEDHQTVEEVLEELGQKFAKRSQILRLGVDPFTITIAQYRRFSEQLSMSGVEIVPIFENLVDAVRSQSPFAENDPMLAFGDQPVIALPDSITGESVASKLERVRKAMDRKNAAILPVTKLDQIAWLYNLRGRDVECNPVFISYAIVTQTEAYLFTNTSSNISPNTSLNTSRLNDAVRNSLAGQVNILEYDQYIPTLRSLVSGGQRVLIAIAQTTFGTYLQLKQVSAKIIDAEHPVETFKAQKNPVEIVQMQQANLKASFAKTLTLKWIEEQISAGNSISERDVADKIEGLYKQQTGFVDLSFPTIAGAGANGSIVHYSNPNPDCKLLNGDLLLLDSGSQFYGGTTDDTRSISIGTPTAEQRDRYTEVLKSHVNCAMQRFPKGTTGSQIDGIARSSLWQNGLDYGHGTGHGVGVFLNVHEGPNGISKRVNQSLDLGTVNSIEPGYYQPLWGGIRLENLYFVKQVPDSNLNPSPNPNQNSIPWYEFESLTYIPFDKKLIDRDKLNPQQIIWLENYYALALAKLSPMLTTEETTWLKQACVIP